MNNTENVFEYIANDKSVTVSLTQRADISAFKKMAAKYPAAYQIIAKNQDGSICGKFDRACFRPFTAPKRALTSDQKAALHSRLKKAKEK